MAFAECGDSLEVSAASSVESKVVVIFVYYITFGRFC